MNVTLEQVAPIERLVELGIKVVLFLFILAGIAVLTGFFIFCVVNDKSAQAKAISGYGDVVFFTAFGKLVWNYFVRSPGSVPALLPAVSGKGDDEPRLGD